jgi:hypothetical protein
MLDDITLLRQPQRPISDPPILEVLLAELGEWSAGGRACARPQPYRRAHIRPQMVDICADDAGFKGPRNVIGEGFCRMKGFPPWVLTGLGKNAALSRGEIGNSERRSGRQTLHTWCFYSRHLRQVSLPAKNLDRTRLRSLLGVYHGLLTAPCLYARHGMSLIRNLDILEVQVLVDLPWSQRMPAPP